jgi:hypothetical protein
MPTPNNITQDPEDTYFDAEGFPQLPLSELAKRLRDMTAPVATTNNNKRGRIKVRSHYRKWRSSYTKKKTHTPHEPNQSTISQWLHGTAQQKKKNPESAINQTPQMQADRSLAMSLHITEVHNFVAPTNQTK